MYTRARLFIPLIAAAAVMCAAAAPVSASSGALAVRIEGLERMMLEMAPESARNAAEIKRVYQEYLEFLVLDGYADIEGALASGGLVPLPEEPIRFNLVPRLDGPHPIGEKDLANQDSYVSARAFTIGCLLDIASRVRSAPIEITSLVRHGEYQDALRGTNANATTSVPMHTMGLAIDIALINTPLETAYEIRDILREMQEAGDLIFIGERQQLVFHVVPHPSRLGHFMEMYTAALGAPSATGTAFVVAAAAPGLAEVSEVHPVVTSEVISVLPADESLWADWFAQEGAASAAAAAAPASRPLFSAVAVLGFLPIFGGVVVLCGAISVRRRRQRD